MNSSKNNYYNKLIIFILQKVLTLKNLSQNYNIVFKKVFIAFIRKYHHI